MQAKSNAPKPVQRKKWRKSTIQLVPAPPPAASEPENVESQQIKPETSFSEGEIALRLPRAMRSATSNNNLLKERNSNHNDFVTKKETGGGSAPTSPYRQAKVTGDKENKEYKL